MPNIEIHGMGMGFGSHLRNQIFDAIREDSTELAAGVVVTVVPDMCTDLALRSKPFLRIIAPESDAAKISRIVKCLKPLGYDMEISTIKQFIEGKR